MPFFFFFLMHGKCLITVWQRPREVGVKAVGAKITAACRNLMIHCVGYHKDRLLSKGLKRRYLAFDTFWNAGEIKGTITDLTPT